MPIELGATPRDWTTARPSVKATLGEAEGRKRAGSAPVVAPV